MRPAFDDIAGLWHRDGSLRDIYVQDMMAGHWERFDRLLGGYARTYTFDGTPCPFPGSRAALANRDGAHLLAIGLNGPALHCHFFVAGQLELDVSPKDIAGPGEHARVLAFVERLAHALALPVDITPENAEHAPFLTYDPVTACWMMHASPQ